MSKTKSVTKKGGDKPVDKALSKVKDAGVTKSAQSPKSKSKQIARDVAAKGDKSKRKKKEPTPSSSSESESDSDEEMDSSSSSESESEDEKPVKKEVKKKAESSSESESESSDEDMKDASSSESESEEEEEKPAKKVKAEPKASKKVESSDSESSESDSDSEKEAAPKKAAAESSDSEESESESEEEAPAKAKKAETKSSESESDDSEESEGSSSSESESEESDESTKVSKKRKAEDEPSSTSKKSKGDEPAPGASANLFVGNLSWNVDEEWLQREFSGYEGLSGVRIMTERDSGRSRGFGYVEFSNSVEAAKAYEGMKDAEIDGRKINLDYATGRPANNNNNSQGGFKDRAQTRARSFGDQASPESDTLFVGNLPFGATEDSVHELFSSKGSILGIRLPTHQESGQPKGFGYVQFSSVDEARAALGELNGAELDGRPVRLDFSTPRANNNAGGARGGGRGGFGGRGGPRGGGRGGRGGFGGRGGAGGAPNRGRGSIPEFKGTKVTF